MKTPKKAKPRRPSSVATLRRVDAPQALANVRPARSKNKYVLRLFVAGATARSHQAILRVRALCEAELKDSGTLEVIDIYQLPHLARANQIVATPTLIIELPTPVRRFIGNLTNITGLFVGLNLDANGEVA